MAQNGTTLSDALQPIDGDEEVVATVQGKDDTRGDIRRAAEFWIVTNMAATSEDATNKSIVLVIDRFIAQAEIERRQLTATRKEAEVFMRRNRDICTGGARCGMSRSCHAPRNQPQRQRVLGKHRTARIRKDGGVNQALSGHNQGKNMEDATNEELIAVENALPGELRQNAAIVWHDEDLGRTYQGALQSGLAILPVPFLVDHQPDLLGPAPAGAAVLGNISQSLMAVRRSRQRPGRFNYRSVAVRSELATALIDTATRLPRCARNDIRRQLKEPGQRLSALRAGADSMGRSSGGGLASGI